MPTEALPERINSLAVRSGVVLTAEQAEQLSEYVRLLARWNHRINLTALAVDPPSDSALDRLIVEPAIASSLIHQSTGHLIDVGSGGGSPGIPLKILRPDLAVTLVESRGKKCAFLREAGRHLGLARFDVVHDRFEYLVEKQGFSGSFDLVSVRAVRTDETFWSSARRLLVPGGAVLWFRAIGSESDPHGSDVVGQITINTTGSDEVVLVRLV